MGQEVGACTPPLMDDDHVAVQRAEFDGVRQVDAARFDRLCDASEQQDFVQRRPEGVPRADGRPFRRIEKQDRRRLGDVTAGRMKIAELGQQRIDVRLQIGRALWRRRGVQYGEIWVYRVNIKTKNK